MRTLYLLFILGLSYGLTAQSLTLVSGKKKQVIEPGHWIEITAGLPSDKYQDDCLCPSWIGQFLGVEGDKMQLKAYHKFERVASEDISSPVRHVGYEGDGQHIPVESILLSDITSLRLKGKGKRLRSDPTGETIGAILITFGMGTLAATPVVEERGELALFGLGEIAAGLLIGFSTPQRQFALSKELHMQSDKLLWQIEGVDD